jgi:hypothetical protein
MGEGGWIIGSEGKTRDERVSGGLYILHGQGFEHRHIVEDRLKLPAESALFLLGEFETSEASDGA